ncbi:MAG TPA: hypothetical protein VNX01_16160, partial [Bacteroidia bacterium]|nr:hypothetical protein [Bacteroidia bacterium]
KAKFIEDCQPGQLKNTMFAWNVLVVNEANKYDVAKFFRKKNVFNDLAPVMKHNKEIDETQMMSLNPYKFDNADETVASIISSYTGGEKTEGLGLAFIVESYNKPKTQAVYYLTFFDIKTKQIIYTEKFTEGPPSGFGIRNYWASTIFKVMKDVEQYKYASWKFKFEKEK